MDLLEKDLEDIIYDDLIKTGGENLKDRGLHIRKPFKTLRQQYIGNYGRADIITYNRPDLDLDFGYSGHRLCVWELKKGLIDGDTLIQASRYATGVERYFYTRESTCDFGVAIRTVLIGREVDHDDDWVHLLRQMESVNVYTYQYHIDGIRFESHNEYILVDEGFKKEEPF